jgi:hypothetical protein
MFPEHPDVFSLKPPPARLATAWCNRVPGLLAQPSLFWASFELRLLLAHMLCASLPKVDQRQSACSFVAPSPLYDACRASGKQFANHMWLLLNLPTQFPTGCVNS